MWPAWESWVAFALGFTVASYYLRATVREAALACEAAALEVQAARHALLKRNAPQQYRCSQCGAGMLTSNVPFVDLHGQN